MGRGGRPSLILQQQQQQQQYQYYVYYYILILPFKAFQIIQNSEFRIRNISGEN